MGLPTRRSHGSLTPHPRRSVSGANGFMRKDCLDWRIAPARADPQPFPPQARMEVKAIACELPATSGVPLSRWSAGEVAREAMERGLVAEISGTTVWRWLREDAIRPFYHRSWIFPRDPDFAEKAGRVLDLYEGRWEGEPLRAEEYVLCADEKTSIQARDRCYPTLPADEDRLMRVEHNYQRKGALAYLAAWDVHRAKLFGRCESKNGIEPFGSLVEQVMRERNPTPLRIACSGSWTTAPPIGGKPRSSALRESGLICGSSTFLLMPPGSIRSRSTSRWSSARL